MRKAGEYICTRPDGSPMEWSGSWAAILVILRVSSAQGSDIVAPDCPAGPRCAQAANLIGSICFRRGRLTYQAALAHQPDPCVPARGSNYGTRSILACRMSSNAVLFLRSVLAGAARSGRI